MNDCYCTSQPIMVTLRTPKTKIMVGCERSGSPAKKYVPTPSLPPNLVQLSTVGTIHIDYGLRSSSIRRSFSISKFNFKIVRRNQY